MNFLDQNNHDTSNLNYSINSSTNPLTQIPSNNNLSLSQDLQNISRQHKPLPITTPACDNNTVGKSNYSSINNILPCPYTEANGFKPKQDQELSKASDRMRSSTASFHENSLSKQKTSLENSLHAERPSTRVSTRPPLNPGDVSKGLSALHQKVDDLIKRGSQIRTSFQGTERLPRAASTENRSHNNPAQVFTLSSIQPEPAEQVVTRNSATTSEAAYVKIHDLSQYSGVSDGRDNTPQLRSSKAPASPYQNFMSTPNKVNSPRSECKDNKSAFYLEIAKNYSDTKYIRKQEQITSHQVQSPLRESGNFQIEEHKPKYDERKLDAIVSRIKGRNSVSPAPRQRSSVTLQEADRVTSAAIRTSWSTSKKIEDSFAERREERTTSIPINWQVSHITPEEKSIDEIPNEKDHNVTGNTTILELLDKKRSASVSKPREGPFEDENGYRNPARGGKGVPGDKKMRIAVPKPGNGVATATVYLQDILKDLQIEKTAKVGSSKDSKITEEIGLGLGLKEKSLNAVVGNVIVAREEGISTKGKQGLNESPAKRTAKYFTEENEEESDVALKQALRSAGIGTAANPRLQGNMERGRALGNEKQKMSSPPKKTEDDSLLLDESVFTVKEGGVNTHRQINLNGKNAKNEGKDVIERNMLDTTCIRNKFLDEEADISDFDFDKNRLDSQEAERSKGNIGASRRFEESYLENLGVKVQRFSVGKGK